MECVPEFKTLADYVIPRNKAIQTPKKAKGMRYRI